MGGRYHRWPLHSRESEEVGTSYLLQKDVIFICDVEGKFIYGRAGRGTGVLK